MVLVIKVQADGLHKFIGSPSNITIVHETDNPVVAGHIVSSSYGRGTFCLFNSDFDELMETYTTLHKRKISFAEFVYHYCPVRVVNK